ncbi:MAG: alpha/beta hydrolase [Spirochaetia bacterium]|jgi:acetyl esterase|nr:alpha/beta hydrolase [Spirochaetia bacterium]
MIFVIIFVFTVFALLIVLEVFRRTKFGKLDHKIAGLLAYSNLVSVDHGTTPIEEFRRGMIKNVHKVGWKYPEVPVVEDLDIPSKEFNIPIRIYRSENAKELPVVLYFHGGGFVRGSNDTVVNICSYLQNKSGAVIISVDYRLAPEFPFPGAIDDAKTVLDWIYKNGPTLGIDPHKIIVAGDSSGGTISAVLSQIARDKIMYQILLYPVTNLKSFTSESYYNFAKGFILTKTGMEWFRSMYLPDKENWTDPKVSPLFETNLIGVPPALIITAAFDVLRDEGKEYADKLSAAGIDTEYINVDGVVHGFISLTGVIRKSREILSFIGKRISEFST